MVTKTETRGRKPLLPKDKKPPQATIKVNDFILPFVNELKGNLKNGKVTKKTLGRLFNVLNNNWFQVNAADEDLFSLSDSNDIAIKGLESEVQRLKDELVKLHRHNAFKPLETTERAELIEKYQTERGKVIRLEGQDRSNKSSIRSLKSKIDRIEHLEHDCQAIKANGERCSRPAVTTVDWSGIEIHTCSQHSKTLKR